MLPDLSRLGMRIAAPPEPPKPPELYEPSHKDWQDRSDEENMVLGGCTLGSQCYETFKAHLVDNMLDTAPQGNGLTVVMLSVGAGTLELRALLELERVFPFRIAQVLLIDPGHPAKKSEQVASFFTAAFLNARDDPTKLEFEVKYFCGANAYAKAMALVDEQMLANTFRPAFVAGLNYNLGLRSLGNREADAEYRQAFTFVDACLKANERLHVVTAFKNPGQPLVVRNESAADYILREEMTMINSDLRVELLTEQEHRRASLRLEQEHRDRKRNAA